MQVIKERTVIDYNLPEAAVNIEPDADLKEQMVTLSNAPALVFDFSNYEEGRPYSQTRQLRTRLGFTGDIVALGARKDNVAMIERCGANIIGAHEKYNVSDLLPFFEEITDYYQPNY